VPVSSEASPAQALRQVHVFALVDELLTPDELAALDGRRSTEGVIVGLP
jgi:hypothetical protein